MLKNTGGDAGLITLGDCNGVDGGVAEQMGADGNPELAKSDVRDDGSHIGICEPAALGGSPHRLEARRCAWCARGAVAWGDLIRRLQPPEKIIDDRFWITVTARGVVKLNDD